MCRFRYASTYDQEKTRFLKDIKDPKAPKSHDKIDLTLMNRLAGATGEGIEIGDYLLDHELDRVQNNVFFFLSKCLVNSQKW